jgi:ribosomal protein S27AE
MPSPNPVPVVFPTNNKSCPKCGYSVNYPDSGSPGQTVGLFYNTINDKTRLTCNKCGFSAEYPPAS